MRASRRSQLDVVVDNNGLVADNHVLLSLLLDDHFQIANHQYALLELRTLYVMLPLNSKFCINKMCQIDNDKETCYEPGSTICNGS